MNTLEIYNVSIPAFVGGSKRLLIDGKWEAASSGKEIETVNPATGEVIARLAQAIAAFHA